MTVLKVWFHASQPDRVHYTVRRAGGGVRHLWEPTGSAWGRLLVEMRSQ